MLYNCWNIKGVMHFELILAGKSINSLSSRYPSLVKRKRVILQIDNALTQRANLTQDKMELEKIKVLQHLVCS